MINSGWRLRAAVARRAAVALLLVAGAARAQGVAPTRSVVRADDGHSLTVWSKRPAGAPRGALLLLHGRTWSSLPNFDLRVPGQRVSLMDALVRRGYAVFALDQRGYGATPRDSSGWITPSRAVEDASSVLKWIAARPASRVGKPVLFGYSQGSRTALLAAQRHPDAMSAVVLYGFPQDVTQPPRAGDAPRMLRKPTTLDGARQDFITPESTPAGVQEAYAAAAVAADPVRTDWRDEGDWGQLDPATVTLPVLLINGERDPYANAANLPAFFSRLATVDRWWVVIGRADHAAHLERQGEFVQAVVSFMER